MGQLYNFLGIQVAMTIQVLKIQQQKSDNKFERSKAIKAAGPTSQVGLTIFNLGDNIKCQAHHFRVAGVHWSRVFDAYDRIAFF